MASGNQYSEYIRKLKLAFHDQPEKHDKLIQIVGDLRSNEGTAPKNAIEEATSILECHKDLLSELNDFLPEDEEIKVEKKTKTLPDAQTFLNSIHIRFSKTPCVLIEFLILMEQYSKGKKEFIEISKEIALLFEEHPDLMEGFKIFSRGEEFKGNSRKDLDLSDRETCGPSYRLVPEFRETHMWSGGSEKSAKVLNNKWLCWASESESYVEERSLNDRDKVEDRKFETEREIGCIRSAIERAEEYMRENNGSSVEQHFSTLNIISIRKLYGKTGEKMIEKLKKSAMEVLPEILVALRKKEQQLKTQLSRCDQACIRYHHKKQRTS